MPSKPTVAAALGLGGLLVATSRSSTFAAAPAARSAGEARGLRGNGVAQGETTSSPVLMGLGVACASSVVALGAGSASRSVRAARVTRQAAREAPAVIAGTGGPLPDSFWDPAGLTNNKTDEDLLFYRAAELKHGRVAMLAVFGWLTNASGYHYLGDCWLKKTASDNPIEAFTQLPMLGVWQMVFFVGALEWLTTVPCPPPKEAPWDVIGMTDVLEEDTPENPLAAYDNMKLQEINNGRLAMIGIIGLISQTLMTGDYGGGLPIINPVFGTWTDAVPKVPFKPPIIYPGQIWPQFDVEWPTLAQYFLWYG